MDKNKLGKYLKYAIGEIALVVIGILIALSINNWNEGKKKQAELNTIFANVKSDLEIDLKAINEVLDIMIPDEPNFKKVMNQKITYNDYETCRRCRHFLMGYPDFKLQNRGLNQLKQFNGKLI